MPFWSSLSPAARNLWTVVGAAYAIQGLVAVPCIISQTDTYYDISGTATYLSCTALSLFLARRAAVASTASAAAGSATKAGAGVVSGLLNGVGGIAMSHPRKLLLSALVIIWSRRLGLYLFDRVKRNKGDSRFEEIKKSPPRFLTAFMMQATWVTLIGLPVYAINVIPSAMVPALGLTDAFGLGVWLAGFMLEVVADRQMKQWSEAKKNKEHDEEFLHSGVWSKSRHPNYAGESIIWIGNAIIASGALVARHSAAAEVFGRGAGLAMCAASPAFITFLLLKVSGVPLVEKKYDKKFSNNKEYQEWKKNTPKFFPKIF